jgi:F-type H+-transporting ATPase subunit epsilon
MSTFQLSIVTANGKAFEGQIESLVAAGTSGFFGVLASHLPMIVSLRNGPLTIKQDGIESFYAVSSGVLEVDENSNCLLLADCAVPTQSLNEANSLAGNISRY